MKTKLSMKQLHEALGEKSKLIGQIFEEAGEDMDFTRVKCLGEGDTTAKVEKIKALNAELAEMKADYEEYTALAKSRQSADDAAGFKGEMPKEQPGTESKARKSLGELFLESAAYKSRGAESRIDIDMKSIMQTGSGYAPESTRLPRVELYPLRSLRVAQVFPTFPTGFDTIKYMEETTHTNNAAEIAEETDASSPTAYGEAALAFTERSVPVEKLPVWIPVTEEQLADVAGIGAFVEGRLGYMVLNKLDSQLVAGTGTPPALRGYLNASGIQTQAKGADPTPDAIYKAMTKIRGTTAGTGFAEPSAVIAHPNDWQDIRLLRTADGVYIFGSPTEPGPDRIWGVPVIVTSAETENTIGVGDFANYAAVYMRQGIEFKISDSHGYLFTSGVLAIKATMRAAVVYFRGTAFCKVTGC
jgi:HK97 family phage major capsid protein